MTSASETHYELTYFNFRGIAEPIRMIFKFAGVPFIDNRLEWDDKWNNELKKTYPWEKLPVLKFEDKILSQSLAIARFLARKFNLTGENEIEAAICDELVETMNDLRSEALKVFLEFDEEKKGEIKNNFVNEAAPFFFKRLIALLKKNREENESFWLVGKKFTWADIYIAYSLEYLEELTGHPFLKESQEIEKFHDHVHAFLFINETAVPIHKNTKETNDALLRAQIEVSSLSDTE